MIGESQLDMEAVLLRESEEYQQLTRRHQELDTELSLLTRKFLLTADEKVEEITLKKKKLAIKDRMARMRRSH